MQIFRPRLLATFVLALLTPLVVGGCSTTAETLDVGDCLRDPSTGTSGVHVVDCTVPHRGQVVGLYEPVGGPYPGVDQLTKEAEVPCQDAFQEFVGSDPLTSVFTLFPLLPTEGAWASGDTTVACIAAIYGDATVKSSFEGARR